ncbi:xanthine dehydrogenase accessory protein XdhC [Roseibium sp. RKSG952]|uniref:xanthine dehydrogenase accessory protein XdhC n=1 Tax=Roseibium sp. RKSG952 TaxID=2529384 RepID=UPI0012BBC1DB|nr:xanthine dehydrogenase accessory protein XdhC [Roseibium sp. RKSG952]MTH97140.1 xanthine dehydrogenase accessory protein XdhC [Roseibium sp. RKSG952]
MRVWGHIAQTLETGNACALVTVAAIKGSTPRETGARMVVRADGGFFGTIGGGTLEFEAIRWAQKALEDAKAGLFQKTVSLGPDLGQCCGGRVDVAIEVISVSQINQTRKLAAMEAGGSGFSTIAKVVDGQPLVRSIHPDTRPDLFHLTQDGQLSETFGDARQPVYLFGAGHVGKAVVLALAPLPFSVSWIDSRADVFPAAVPPNTRKIASDRPAEELMNAPDGAFIVVMTHSHALDEEIISTALKSQRFGYCGVIGSATKRARFRKRLKTRGLSDPVLEAMVCPIGVSDIKSKHPAAIAAGIAVDLLHRNEAAHQQNGASKGVAQILTLGQ